MTTRPARSSAPPAPPRTPEVTAGDPWPLGASVTPAGVNFSVFARGSTGLELLLFDGPEAGRPARTIALEPRAHRSYLYWHAFVPGLRAGQVYAYRAHGPHAPERGLRFDATKVLLDPYGRAVCGAASWSRAAAAAAGDNVTTALRSVVADVSAYDWKGDRPLHRP